MCNSSGACFIELFASKLACGALCHFQMVFTWHQVKDSTILLLNLTLYNNDWLGCLVVCLRDFFSSPLYSSYQIIQQFQNLDWIVSFLESVMNVHIDTKISSTPISS
jgi:hypothetical protein